MIELRRWPEPELPEHPYPVLLPIDHPDLLVGRAREQIELRVALERDIPITSVYAVSGTGKSSFLYAGLVRGLRREGRPAAYDRHPHEPGLATRLAEQLIDGKAAVDDPQAFAALLRSVREQAQAPPVLVIDQFEDLLRRPDSERARMRFGILLAASASSEELSCRWVLAYRREFHGDVMLWLDDVLRSGIQEEAGPLDLPRNFSGPERMQTFPLPPLAASPPGTTPTADAAADVFRAVISKPLKAVRDSRRFSPEGLDRLAQAFGEARERSWEAPLLPELQVVLAHLLETNAGTPDAEIQTPENVTALIDQALEDHLRRALDTAFPSGFGNARGKSAKALRTRALLALRELADAEGRRGDALSGEVLARAIGEEGAEVLEKIATASTRLVVPVRRQGELAYVLSHDRLAEVLVRLVDEGRFEGLGVDRRLLELRRFVALQCGLYAAGEVDSGTEVPVKDFERIEAHREALLWGEERERWWEACRQRHRRKVLKTRALTAGVAVLLLLISFGTRHVVERRQELDALFEEVAQGDPGAAFVAAHALLVQWERSPEEIRERLRTRAQPIDLLERGISDSTGEPRDAAVSRIAEMILPLITEEAPEDPVRIANFVWALDFFALQEKRTREMRDAVLATLRENYPPPPLPEPEDPRWTEIPAGTFWMGARPDEGRDDPSMTDEHPQHRVTISSPFRIAIYETTNAEFRRLFHQSGSGDADLPVANVTWSEAYTYAAWLGGRLPTAAEAEYVRRGDCDFPYCDRDGEQASLDEVAWWVGNAADPESGAPLVRPVGLLEPNPWGLYDLYGNVNELCADWYLETYSATDRIDPPGPTTGQFRTGRGGSTWEPAEWIAASAQITLPPENASRAYGLRVWLPCSTCV